MITFASPGAAAKLLKNLDLSMNMHNKFTLLFSMYRGGQRFLQDSANCPLAGNKHLEYGPLSALSRARRGARALSTPHAMNNTAGIILFLCLIFGSLTLVSLVNRVQTRNRLINQKVAQLRRRLDELESIGAEIDCVLETMLVPKLINDEVLDIIASIDKLRPEGEWLEARLEQARDIDQKLNSDQRITAFNRIQSSDAAIARRQHALTQAARIVRRHRKLNHINATELESLIAELAWAYLLVDVVSNIAQGHQAVNRGDLTVAFGYYRKGQNLLMKSDIQDPRRHRFIREIEEILAGKRLAISEELMPESDFNPSQKPKPSNTSQAKQQASGS